MSLTSIAQTNPDNGPIGIILDFALEPNIGCASRLFRDVANHNFAARAAIYAKEPALIGYLPREPKTGQARVCAVYTRVMKIVREMNYPLPAFAHDRLDHGTLARLAQASNLCVSFISLAEDCPEARGFLFELHQDLVTRAAKIATWMEKNQHAYAHRPGLSLNQLSLGQLPQQIGYFSQVATLDLEGNRLTALPQEIGRCTQLRVLNLDGNRLTDLREIGRCTELRYLSLVDNSLTELSPEIGSCAGLENLNLINNRLNLLAPEIGRCTRLRELYLANNRLLALPQEIGLLAQLRSLQAPENRLTKLPQEIGNCTRLQYLDLSDNQLTELPREIGRCAQLRSLDLSNNPIVELPEELDLCSKLEELHLDQQQRARFFFSPKIRDLLIEFGELHEPAPLALPAPPAQAPAAQPAQASSSSSEPTAKRQRLA